MNVTITPPASLVLDAAQLQRADDVGKPRVVIMDGYTFTKSVHGLHVSYTWCRSYANTVEIIPVGRGRYGVIDAGRTIRIVPANQLWSALLDFRRGAAMALEDRRDAERARQ